MFDNEDKIPARNLPIYKKGEEIFDVIREICDLIPEENEHLQHVKLKAKHF